MIRVHQTKFGEGAGNCFSACIASLLELPLEEVPFFCADVNWRESTDRWLSPRGYFYMDVTLKGDMRDELCRFWGYHVISGDGPRGLRHSVIGLAGRMVFDPHPSGEGLIGDDFGYGFLVPLDPGATREQTVSVV